MKKQLVAAALSLGLLGPALAGPTSANDGWGGTRKIKQVLLVSVDGMHALDVANYVKNHPGSALAELAGHGITYSNARTPARGFESGRGCRRLHQSGASRSRACSAISTRSSFPG